MKWFWNRKRDSIAAPDVVSRSADRAGEAISRDAVPASTVDKAALPSTGAPLSFDENFLRRIEQLGLRLQRVSDAVGGRRGTRRLPAADFIDHRPYSPGDDLRHIDWNAAARHDEVYVKVGQVMQSAEVHILLDRSASMAVMPDKWLRARELAAALGWMSLANGDRVTLTTFPEDDDAPTWSPARGTGRGRDLLNLLSTLPASARSATQLEPAMRKARGGPSGGLIVLISDLWLADDLERALALAPPPRWEVLVLQCLDPAELQPALDGAYELQDAETGERLHLVVDEEARVAYRRALNQRFEQLRSVAGRRGATFALLPADGSLERSVIPFLQRRAILGGS